MDQVTWRDRWRYRFDNFMARGTGALLFALAVASAVMVLTIAGVVALARVAPVGDDGEPLSFLALAWMGLLRTLDTGTMGGDTGSAWFLAAMLAVTIGGVFTVSTLIGVLNNGLESKLSALRKGRSRVIETEHTIILGWSQQIFPILSELLLANESRKGACILVMGESDKAEMEDEIAERIGPTGKTRIVCRSGSPIDLADLKIVSLQTSRSIIVLSPEGDDPDASVIKTLLAITNAPDRRPEPYHVVAEIRDPKNIEVARMVGRDEVELLLVGELISRIIAQTCRQSGLSVIYTELFDFGGDEIYFREEPSLTGKSFGEVLGAYDDSAVLGVAPATGRPRLNPPMDQPLSAGDRLILVAQDDDSIRLSGRTATPSEEVLNPGLSPGTTPERTLLLGWNWRAAKILSELGQYVPLGSHATVVTETAGMAEGLANLADPARMTIEWIEGDTADRRLLEGLGLETYDHIIVLSYSDDLEVQRADAKTLVTLLHLREIGERLGRPFSIVSEMLDVRNRALAEVTKADDFIVSDRLISLMLAQISENKHLAAVFDDLLDPEGSEIYLKPAAAYVRPDTPVEFYDVLEAARRKGEVAFGYRLAADAKKADRAYGIRLNPRKSETLSFTAEDRIVVLAES
jgi:voltage-gated potassium channel Kch